jgi:hypothetical protein
VSFRVIIDLPLISVPAEVVAALLVRMREIARSLDGLSTAAAFAFWETPDTKLSAIVMGWRFAFGVDRQHRVVIVYEALASGGRREVVRREHEPPSRIEKMNLPAD